MNKDKLLRTVARKLNKDNKEVKNILEEIFIEIINSVSSGEEVRIVGFGLFKSRIRVGRWGRNPHNNKALYLPETKTPCFLAGKVLRDKVKKTDF